MSRVTPVLLYSLTGAVVLSSLSSCKEKKSEEVKKTMNVVYIMCDDHSYQTSVPMTNVICRRPILTG